MADDRKPIPDNFPSIPPDVQARIFRSRGMAVYPGKILVTRGGSWGLHAIEDRDFVSTNEHIVGVSLWGPLPAYTLGTAFLEPQSRGQFCVPVIGDPDREPVDIPLLDTWIARADALRGLMLGTASSYGPPPLSDGQVHAAGMEIFKAIRNRAVALLKVMPVEDKDVNMALAKVVDASSPETELLTNAIQQLITSLKSWSAESKQSIVEKLDAVKESHPSARELREVANISNSIFRSITKAAGINHGLRSHESAKRPYTPDEVAKMLEVVSKGNYLDRERILTCWAPFANSKR